MVGSERHTCFETETRCIMALQGLPRSLILAPIESAYAISYWSSIVTLFLSCPVSEILQISWEDRPHPYFSRILGMFPLDYFADVVAPRSENPELIVRVINFELVQSICPRCINVTDRQTDGRTYIARCKHSRNDRRPNRYGFRGDRVTCQVRATVASTM